MSKVVVVVKRGVEDQGQRRKHFICDRDAPIEKRD